MHLFAAEHNGKQTINNLDHDVVYMCNVVVLQVVCEKLFQVMSQADCKKQNDQNPFSDTHQTAELHRQPGKIYRFLPLSVLIFHSLLPVGIRCVTNHEATNTPTSIMGEKKIEAVLVIKNV
jgi:hypothetical protein